MVNVSWSLVQVNLKITLSLGSIKADHVITDLCLHVYMYILNFKTPSCVSDCTDQLAYHLELKSEKICFLSIKLKCDYKQVVYDCKLKFELK